MPRQLWIDDELEFRDKTHLPNVKGPMQEAKVHFHDHFTDDTLSTDRWASTVTGGTHAVSHTTYSGGTVVYTSDATDNEAGFLATALCFEDDLNAIAEAKILITDVSGTAMFFGFSEARSETSPAMPIDYADGTLATVVGRDAVGFICDFDDGVNGINSIIAVAAKAGTLHTAADSGTDWEDAVWHVLRVALDPDGNATFYLDGESVGYMAACITSGTKLCAIIAVANREAGINTTYIDRVDVWQDEET